MLTIALGWVFAVAATAWLLGSEDVPARTTVAGVDIGGLDRESAIDVLNQVVGPAARVPIRIKAFGNDFKVQSESAGITVDAVGTVDALRTRRWNPFDLLAHWMGRGDVRPAVFVDELAAESELGRIAAASGQQMREPRVVYQGLRPIVHNGRRGTEIDRPAAIAAFASAFPNREPVVLPTTPMTPTVSNSAATALANGLATRAVSAPITLTIGGKAVPVEPTVIAKSLVFEGDNGQMRPEVSGSTLHRLLAKPLAQMETPVKEAGWDTTGSTAVVTESRDGLGVKDAALAVAVAGVLDKAGDERAASAELRPQRPRRTTEQAQALGITEQLSTFTQEFPYAAYRVQNIGLAAEKMDGTVLRPGATFSLNDTVGPRTLAAGFTNGYVIGDGGRLQEDLGGGVSTAATAVWTAAFFAGLEKVEQGTHVFWISRYRPGLEATVYWGQLDLKFRNDTPNAVLITAKTTNTSITVSVWGKKQYDSITAVSGPRENVRAFPSVNDDSDGCVAQNGVDGFDIGVDRVFNRGGKEVKRQRFNTHYIPAAAVTCTGKPVKPPA